MSDCIIEPTTCSLWNNLGEAVVICGIYISILCCVSESSVCLPYTSNYISVFVHYVFVYVINVHMPILRTTQWTNVVGVVVGVDDDADDDVSQHRAWIIVSVIIILDLPNCKLIKLVDKTLIWQQRKWLDGYGWLPYPYSIMLTSNTIPVDMQI